jgi:FSR family fosmidomycin resistance protein-like MFS transporter
MVRGERDHGERNVMVLAGASHFATHFFELMFPTLAVTLALDLGLPLTEVLSWSFAGYLLFGLGALPAGLLADAIGARRVVLIGLAGMGVSALAASEAAPGRSLALCLAGVGLFASCYHPAGMSLISRAAAMPGRALGINGIWGNLGIAATPALTAALVGHFGPSHTFQMAGLASCGLAAGLSFLRIPERPHERERGGGSVPSRSRRKLFWVVCVATVLAGISYRGNTIVQPAYFAERVSLLGFGAATSAVYLFGIAGQYVGGMLADRHDLRWLYLGFHAASLPFLLLMAGLHELPLMGATALFVFFSLGMQPIENSLFANLTPLRWRATGYGIKFALTLGVGSAAVWLVGWAQGGGDLNRVFLFLAAIVALLVLTIGWFVSLSARTPMRNPRGALAARKLALGEPAV